MEMNKIRFRFSGFGLLFDETAMTLKSTEKSADTIYAVHPNMSGRRRQRLFDRVHVQVRFLHRYCTHNKLKNWESDRMNRLCSTNLDLQ